MKKVRPLSKIQSGTKIHHVIDDIYQHGEPSNDDAQRIRLAPDTYISKERIWHVLSSRTNQGRNIQYIKDLFTEAINALEKPSHEGKNPRSENRNSIIRALFSKKINKGVMIVLDDMTKTAKEVITIYDKRPNEFTNYIKRYLSEK